MENHVGDITGIALVAVAALAFGIGMRRLGQPAVLGYIIAGAWWRTATPSAPLLNSGF